MCSLSRDLPLLLHHLSGDKTFPRKKSQRSNVILKVSYTFPELNNVYLSKNNWIPTGYALYLPSGDKIFSRKKKVTVILKVQYAVTKTNEVGISKNNWSSTRYATHIYVNGG